MKIVIVGGGVIGLCTAYYLEKKGHEITVVDKGDLTNGCSFGNAGYVCPSHFTPLASPGIIAQGLRWMLSSSSPFYIKPRLDPDLVRWMIQFWKKSNQHSAEANALQMNYLLQLSRQLTSGIKNELGNHFRMEEKGILMLYKTAATEKHEIELAEKSKKYQIDANILSAEEIQELEPNLKVDAKGGVLYPGDAHLHPGELMQTLYKHLLQRNVSFQTNTTVTSFEKKNSRITAVVTNNGKYECDELVLAAGSWLPALAKLLRLQILLQPGKGYSITFSGVTNNLHYPSILIDNRVAMTPLGSDLRMGGTMEISGINSKVLVKRAKAIFDATKQYYPDLPLKFPEVDKIWSGLRPLTPDGLPYIGRHSNFQNLVIAGGHAMLGVSLAAGTGKVVQEIIDRTDTSVPINAFAVQRFN